MTCRKNCATKWGKVKNYCCCYCFADTCLIYNSLWLSGSKDIGYKCYVITEFTSQKQRHNSKRNELIAYKYGKNGNKNLMITAFEIFFVSMLYSVGVQVLRWANICFPGNCWIVFLYIFFIHKYMVTFSFLNLNESKKWFYLTVR
jgi:hypothetical protein